MKDIKAGVVARLAFALAAWGSRPAAQAGDYLVKRWDVDDGLFGTGVSDACQAADGYLWVSTLSGGLSRFDGVRFVNFDSTNTPGLDEQGVRRLIPDPTGRLWLNGFDNRLMSWEDGRVRSEYPGPVALRSLLWADSGRIVFVGQGYLLLGTPGMGDVRSWKLIQPPKTFQWTHFIADRHGDFWYRRTDQLLERIRGEQADVVRLPAGSEAVTALASDGNGGFAVGTDKRLYVWNDGRFAEATPRGEDAELDVEGLVSDGEGGWWVDGNGRMRRCQGGRWIAEAPEWKRQGWQWSGMMNNQFDHRGGVWMSYHNGGLIHIGATGQLDDVTAREGLFSNRVVTFFEDRENDLWVTFEHGGLACVRQRRFHVVGRDEGLHDTLTTTVCEDRAGAIWIGTGEGTVARWKDGACTNFTLPRVGQRCEMSVVYPDADGRTWIGTQGNGLFVYDGKAFRSFPLPGRRDANISSLLSDREDRLWIASSDGLFLLSASDVRRVAMPDSVRDSPTCLAEGRDGSIWIGTNAGALLRWQDGAFHAFEPDRPLRRRFSGIMEDADGTLWIGTVGAGLLRFKDGRFAALTTEQGLPANAVSQMLEDPAGNLWFGSRAGVFSAPKAALDACAEGTAKSVPCRIYGRDDGLPTLGCSIEHQPTAWRGGDGRLWFATANGVTFAQPEAIETNAEPPAVVIEEVRVDGTVQAISGNRSQAGLVVGPGRHNLLFRYTGLNFSAPDRIRFKYRLDGLDADWVDAMGDRTASYNSVPFGTYRFRVLACNGDGVWSSKEASLPLIIRPHLWEVRGFGAGVFVMSLLSVAGSVYGVLRHRHRRQFRALEQQRALDRERTRIAQDIHDDLGASLTRITMLSQSALNKIAPTRAPKKEVTRIYTTARAMTHAMDEIIWAVDPSYDSLESLADYLAEFVEEFLSPTGLRFRIDFPLALPPWTITSEVRHNVFLALKEALNNVVKHARATEVVVTLAIAHNSFVLSVEDNGRGLEMASAGINSPGATRAVGGNGLGNMCDRLEKLGGHCTREGIPGRGTRIRFEVEVGVK